MWDGPDLNDNRRWIESTSAWRLRICKAIRKFLWFMINSLINFLFLFLQLGLTLPPATLAIRHHLMRIWGTAFSGPTECVMFFCQCQGLDRLKGASIHGGEWHLPARLTWWNQPVLKCRSVLSGRSERWRRGVGKFLPNYNIYAPRNMRVV
jgi:hypothetical protein